VISVGVGEGGPSGSSTPLQAAKSRAGTAMLVTHFCMQMVPRRKQVYFNRKSAGCLFTCYPY
jgi:hypothetical protein